MTSVEPCGACGGVGSVPDQDPDTHEPIRLECPVCLGTGVDDSTTDPDGESA